MRRLLLLLVLALPLRAETTVALLHFSDYHSHALPFFADEGERGGIARAIGYLRSEKKKGALVFNGGDMVNKGAPAWSDRYGCVEWPWLNGVVDAMAFGNHDADYGETWLAGCRESIRYPILSANTPGFEPYRVFVRGGVRIGVFAVAGSDFSQLVKAVPFQFGDPIEAARSAVKALREKEGVDAVVMIGHEHAEADYALAAAVPGIDLIFGSHSHLRRDLTQIPGTKTWFISPSQYLTYISRVELSFDGRALTAVRGTLVPVDGRLPSDRRTRKRVAGLQRGLERDPQYRELFLPIARLDAPMTVKEVAMRTLEVMRSVADADVALSTSSSFRRPLPAGPVTMELLRGALPYDNEIVVCTMDGAALQKVFDFAGARSGTDSEPYVSGRPGRIVPDRPYRVVTTDYLAFVAYRDAFACDARKSGLRVRDELRKSLMR
jgi:5'-nucleotidase/UDP-sugar diphosphatase